MELQRNHIEGTFIQINSVADGLVLQEHVWPVARIAGLNKCHTYQLPDILILPPTFISLHTSLCITLTQ